MRHIVLVSAPSCNSRWAVHIENSALTGARPCVLAVEIRQFAAGGSYEAVQGIVRVKVDSYDLPRGVEAASRRALVTGAAGVRIVKYGDWAAGART